MKFLRRLARKRYIAQNKHFSTQLTPKGHTLGVKPYDSPPVGIRKFTATAPSDYQFVDLSKDTAMPQIWDQKEMGACTAFSTMGVYTFVARKEGLKFPEPSQMFAYYESRYQDGDSNQDAGSTNATEWSVATNIGVVPLTDWPYTRANLFKTPPEKIVAEAANHKAVKDYQLDGSLESIQSCLTEGYPLNFSVTLYPAFEGAYALRNGIIPMPNPKENSPIGGHSMAIVGIGYGKDWIADGQFKKADPNTLYVKVRNSWGKDYFQNGYLLLPFDYLGLYGYQSDYWTARKVS